MQSCPAPGIVTIHITIPINRKTLSGMLARGLKNVCLTTFSSVLRKYISPPPQGFEWLSWLLKGKCTPQGLLFKWGSTWALAFQAKGYYMAGRVWTHLLKCFEDTSLGKERGPRWVFQAAPSVWPSVDGHWEIDGTSIERLFISRHRGSKINKMWPLAWGPGNKEIHIEFKYHVIKAMMEVGAIYL